MLLHCISIGNPVAITILCTSKNETNEDVYYSDMVAFQNECFFASSHSQIANKLAETIVVAACKQRTSAF